MFQTLASQVVLALALITVAYAFWKGGPAERVGSVFNASLCVGVTMFQALSDQAFGTLPILIADGLLATGFLILAFRYASLWLASAMLLEGAIFTIHASSLIGLLPESHVYYYYAAMNALGMLVMITILIGTTAPWLRRRKRATALSA